MRKIKELSLAILLALATAISAASYAQDVTRKDAKKKTDSCCAMECCKTGTCCKGDSCEMKNGQQNHSSKHEGCCCCNGDSCEMGDARNKEKQG